MMVTSPNHLESPATEQEILHDVVVVDLRGFSEDIIEDHLDDKLELKFQKLFCESGNY
jgi:hypothetical protein